MIWKLRAVDLLLLFASLSVFGSEQARGEVRLAGFFGDHMVLQQQLPIKLWGWAEAGESVTASIDDQSATTTADEAGNWRLELPARAASNDPIQLTVQGSNTIEIEDVLIGEVWLCSGQSNMEWIVQRSTNAAAEIQAATHPTIRHIKFGHRPSMEPLADLQAPWQVCSPETVANFTAAGYFMARRLNQELNVPIGLINASWGGTRVEPWTAPVGFANVPELSEIHQAIENRTVGSDADQAGIVNHQDPTMLYNGMIHAIVGLPIRGAIWYQGESNHTEGMLYFHKKKALINGWRQLWGQGDFPFYFVQIAPFQYGDEAPETLAAFWEAQAAVEQLPHTGMVVINDIATLDDIHPPNKQDVGSRLAALALRHEYGRDDVVAHSPTVKKMEIVNGAIKLTFQNSSGGLKTRDGQPPSHFEIIGPDSDGYQSASATIDGDTVTLRSDAVAAPVAYRFGWHKLAEPNLTGATGLPVGAVRGGTEPKP
jgi:sialate O-acetylesterase